MMIYLFSERHIIGTNKFSHYYFNANNIYRIINNTQYVLYEIDLRLIQGMTVINFHYELPEVIDYHLFANIRDRYKVINGKIDKIIFDKL